MLLTLLGMHVSSQKKAVSYEIEKDRLLYTIGYAHLDTEWNWDYAFTINELIPNTMDENFRMFEKYPDYVFNFTGSRRYRMMKEYYPEKYKKVVDYVKAGRWHVSGSSVDEGEVNVSSSESVLRQILYGNKYFKVEFGKESYDYMLPDCFGFLNNLPTVFHHAGLLGFSTQKLTWRSAAGVPFNVGVWKGPDGKSIIAALNATNYTGRVNERLDQEKYWTDRLTENQQKYTYPIDYRYYGVGDEGGAPRERDIKNAVGSIDNADSDFKVLLTSSDQMYKDITPAVRAKLPVYQGDLLLIEHSAGSMTSQSFMKRMNRKNEMLAQSAEQAAVFADWMQLSNYPFGKINESWDLVLGSQFHDILPGTSIPQAYSYAWNDEFIAANGFAESLKSSISSLVSVMNTQAEGKSVAVYNPVPAAREDVVKAEITVNSPEQLISVFDANGNEVPSQILKKEGNKLTVLFRAEFRKMGIQIYDIRETSGKLKENSLFVSERTLENKYLKVTLADNGDIASIYDKINRKEVLQKPAKLEFLEEQPREWPAWNMDWEDRVKPPVDFMHHDAQISIVENGPVRVAIQVVRKGMNSVISQQISLSAGEAGKRVEVSNLIDWQSSKVSLKASFPLVVSNNEASYHHGVGTIKRGNNDEKKFEVPAREWIDLTQPDGQYGVSILEDCKYGSDKPDNQTLRLTLMYTPGVDRGYKYQSSQDWGMHTFSYAIYPHKGNWSQAQTPWQAKCFNQPLLAFETAKHPGNLGRKFEMIQINQPEVGLMALKKMEDSDCYVIRINELSGKDLKNIQVSLPMSIAEAYEVNGQEKKLGNVKFNNNILSFDLGHYSIKSIAFKLKENNQAEINAVQSSVKLPFNTDVISFDDNRSDGEFGDRRNIPAELLPDYLLSDNIRFEIGNKADEQLNAVSCAGQTIELPTGKYNQLHLLVAASNDTEAAFEIGNLRQSLSIQRWNGMVGQHYNRALSRDQLKVEEIYEPYSKTNHIAWFASHTHQQYPMKNLAYQYCYLYRYDLKIPEGSTTITLPDNRSVKILSMTASSGEAQPVKPLQALYDDFAGFPKMKLRR